MPYLLSVLVVLLAFSGCVSDVEYMLQTQRYSTQLNTEIESIVDNGCYHGAIYLEIAEQSPDNFYTLESTEALDSVFTSISYSGANTPHLEDLFPENGILVIYIGWTCFGSYFHDHTIFFSGKSLNIDLAYKLPADPPDPGGPTVQVVVPVGIVHTD
jgi:hypothetical protein